MKRGLNCHLIGAGGRLTAALSLLEGRSDSTDKFLEIVYECNLCGLCDVACKLCRYNMEPLEVLRQLRFKLVEDGQTLPRRRYRQRWRNFPSRPASTGSGKSSKS